MLILKYLPDIITNYWKEILGFTLLSVASIMVNIQEGEVGNNGQSSDNLLCSSGVSKDGEHGV